MIWKGIFSSTAVVEELDRMPINLEQLKNITLFNLVMNVLLVQFQVKSFKLFKMRKKQRQNVSYLAGIFSIAS